MKNRMERICMVMIAYALLFQKIRICRECLQIIFSARMLQVLHYFLLLILILEKGCIGYETISI